MNTYETWSVIGTWAAALATTLAAVVALIIGLRDIIWNLVFPVKIHLEWEDCEPYAQSTSWNEGSSRPTEVMFRIKLINHGKTGAKDVQVIIENLERLTAEDQIMGKGFTPLRGFVPVSLKWTHLDQPKLDFFPQGSSRFLDFGLWSWVQGQAHPALFLSTEVALRMGGSTLHSAKYRCQITVTGRDGMYHRAWWSFEFADNDARYGEHNIKFIGFKLEVEKILAGAQLCKGPMGCACTRH